VQKDARLSDAPARAPGPRKQGLRVADHRSGKIAAMSAYDEIAHLYDPWSRSVVEDVGFYVEEAVRSGGPVVELGVGTGRIAVPVAVAGIRVIGVDTSEGMLRIAAEQAELAGATDLIDLREGDMRDPPVTGTFPLVVCPFRSLLHMETDPDRRSALRAIRRLLAPDGRFVFDVFAPGADDIAETHNRWLEREPGIWERASWDARSRTLILRVRGDGGEAEMSLAWLSVGEWRALLAEEGFRVDALYGWFDRSPWRGGEDSVWVCRASS
jgi:SAM-dependent methyltransferase